MTEVISATPPALPIPATDRPQQDEPPALFEGVIDRALRAAPPIPSPSQLPGYRERRWTEAQNAKRLEETLTRLGWSVNREVVVYGDHDRRFRVDLLVRHHELGDICGVVEVKATDGEFEPRRLADMTKQAADYVGCRCLATGWVVEWAAVYPVRGLHNVFSMDAEGLARVPAQGRGFSADHISLAWVSGLFELASKHLKVHALCHRPHAGLTLMYLNRHVIWDERHGFRSTALPMLCGKRQVGGRRL